MRIEWFRSQRNSLATNFSNSISSKNTSDNQEVYEQTTEQIEIIGFQDEGRKEEINAPILQTQVPVSLVQATTKEDKNHTIPGFLQRAYQIDNFQWSVNDTPGTVLKQYRFPDALLAQPALSRKAFNFFGLRAGVEFIVLVNKQPFQEGNLLISYLPGAKYNAAKNAMCQTTSPASNANLGVLTGMPRVNLDLMDATRADMTVPYASPFIYYNLLNGEGTIGDFYITVYSQLRDVAADATVSVQVMARFVDVDLQFPAGTDPVSFSKVPGLDTLINKFTQKPDLVALQNLIREGKSLVKKHNEGVFRFQMNSENLRTVNFKPKALPNMAVANESNNSHILSLSSQNHLPSANMGEASANEMLYKTMVQIPVYFDRFTITSDIGGNTNVYSKIVTLLDYTNVDATTGSVGIDYPTFLGQNFSKWRSSFKYNFRFVKTTFHSLRVRIFFAPNTTSESGVDRNAIVSKIIDLKDNNFVEFEVPFIWPHPFLNTEVGNTNLGVLGVDVLTKMVHPTTVPSTIDVIVERSAGQDFELNLPKQLSYFPFDPTPSTETVVVTSNHHVSRRPGVSQPIVDNDTLPPVVPVPKPKPSEFLPPITSTFVNTLTNIDGEVRKYVLQHANDFYDKVKNLTALNELGQYKKIDIPMLDLTLDQINDKINYLSVREIRRRETGADEVDGWKKDLTTEGVEPNPGPIRSLYFPVTTDPVDRIIENVGVAGDNVRIVVTVAGYGDYPPEVYMQLDFGNEDVIQIACNYDKEINFYYQLTSNDLTFKSSGKGTKLGCCVSVFTGSSAASTSVNIANIPLQVDVATNPVMTQITNVPLPVTGGGGGGTSSVVATRSDQPATSFKFQMNHEQDSYRPGYDDTSYVRPVISSQADLLSLGSTISSVGDMIHRSTLLTSLTPTNPNDIYVIPHSIGVVRKDASNNNIVSAADMYSYYASLFAFARGGVNLRLVTSPDFAYNVILDPDSDTLTATETAVAGFLPTATSATQSLQQQVSIQQVVKPSLEGFGEITIPFYSDTYMYYVNPVISQQPKVSASQMQLPYTTLDLRPLGQFTTCNIFRAACTDVEFSYLTGPPRVISLV